MITRLWFKAKAALEDEAGDVPGWVLITLMTATLVMLVWAFAGPAITDLIEDALRGVSFPTP